MVCFGLNDVHGGDAGLGAYQDCLREIFRALRRAGSMPVFMTPNMMCTGTTARYAACPPLREMQAHCCALQLNGQVDRYMQAARDVCEEARVPSATATRSGRSGFLAAKILQRFSATKSITPRGRCTVVR